MDYGRKRRCMLEACIIHIGSRWTRCGRQTGVWFLCSHVFICTTPPHVFSISSGDKRWWQSAVEAVDYILMKLKSWQKQNEYSGCKCQTEKHHFGETFMCLYNVSSLPISFTVHISASLYHYQSHWTQTFLLMEHQTNIESLFTQH